MQIAFRVGIVENIFDYSYYYYVNLQCNTSLVVLHLMCRMDYKLESSTSVDHKTIVFLFFETHLGQITKDKYNG